MQLLLKGLLALKRAQIIFDRKTNFFFKEEPLNNLKHCPKEIVSSEITPREESKLNALLKGKHECVPTTPKILQSPGTLFPIIWVKKGKMNKAKIIRKG